MAKYRNRKNKFRIEIYSSPMNVEMGWRLRSPNWKILAHGRGLNSEVGVIKSLNAVRRAFMEADLKIVRVVDGENE